MTATYKELIYIGYSYGYRNVDHVYIILTHETQITRNYKTITLHTDGLRTLIWDGLDPGF